MSSASNSKHSENRLSFSLVAAFTLSTLCGGAIAFADKPTPPDVVVLTNPDVSYGAGAGTIAVHGMRKGQSDGPKHDKPFRAVPGGNKGRPGGGGGSSDPVVQSTSFTSNGFLTTGRNFEGLGNGLSSFSVNSAPPDTNGAVGATQYVQWVNESFAVFDKSTGTLLSGGPIAGNELFQALGATHPCAVNNDGDPIAQYDKANSRWILTQFSVTNGGSLGYWQCIAISQTSDATGAYNVYAYKQPNFNDYPKFGVWNGTYYATYNMFSGNSFAGARLCAYDGASMRAGATAAAEQCFQLSSGYGGVLPADVDGAIAPPTGSNEYFLSFGANTLNTWRFHVDFVTSSNTTLTGPYITPVESFTEACNGGTCVPQPGTTQQLDSLGDRLMYRLSYRHFSDGHEALFVNHSVNPGSVVAGVRWYELHPATSGGVTVVQQSTYAPGGGLNRWMGSIASDKNGNVALGYSTSSASSYPAIHYSYRTPTDTSNKLGSEQLVFAGTGAQLRTLNRWGDYSAMTVDPIDDCTFWYTNEYLLSSGTFNWHTRIASFTVAGCH